MSFIFGFLAGCLFSIIVLFLRMVYVYYKTAEQAHKDGYEYPYY